MIQAFVSGEDLEGFGDELAGELLPRMQRAVDAATEILVEEWKAVASRTSGGGTLSGGERAVRLNVHATETGGAVFSRKGRRVLRTQSFTSRAGAAGTHQGAAEGEPLTKLTGEYVRSIERSRSKRKGNRVEGYAISRLPWAARQEFGGTDRLGRYLPPHPTARVAEANARRRMLDAIDERLGVS